MDSSGLTLGASSSVRDSARRIGGRRITVPRQFRTSFTQTAAAFFAFFGGGGQVQVFQDASSPTGFVWGPVGIPGQDPGEPTYLDPDNPALGGVTVTQSGTFEFTDADPSLVPSP